MSLRTPLGRVRGLGSAKEGTAHWWQQRLTAVILIPLSVWLMVTIVSLTRLSHAVVTAWMESPLNAVLLIILILTLFHHAQLGVQVVIEDYIHSEWQKLGCIILVKFLALFAGLASILAVLKVFLGF
ncbi:MAG: succinate dehydrogenase, hydrophobic membrane anchor protein [Gammaproteobacteria bacterium]